MASEKTDANHQGSRRPRRRKRGVMSTKSKKLLRAVSLFIFLFSLAPAGSAGALVASAPPPVDMFQLPWDQGIAWVAIDGIDNGSKRPSSSSHNYKLGGAIDFAPRSNMVTGENTSNFWVTAAADGTVIGTATCYVTLAHASGWITQYQFLGNIQVKLGDVVARNQRLGIIADGVKYKYCPGFQEINVPHLHFMLRPSTVGATFAGWEVKYNSLFNITTFSKGLITLGLFKPLLNVLDTVPTPTPTVPVTTTPGTPASPTGTLPTATNMFTSTPGGFPSPSATPTLFGPFVSTTVNPQTINLGETTLATVSLNNVPAGGYTSAEFTCHFAQGWVEVSNITATSLFGADAVVAINNPDNRSFIVAIAGSSGNKATTSGAAFTFDVKGLQIGETPLYCEARVSAGDNVLTTIPFTTVNLTIVGDATSTPTFDLTPSSSPTSTPPPPSFTPTPTEPSVPITPVASETPTSVPNDWLTFTNLAYGFQFRYPPQGVIEDGRTDTFARIDLPFVQGTNLQEKYLHVSVAENPIVCQGPLAQSGAQTSETVVINGLTFLKQTAGDAGVGHLHEWVAYSTQRDNICVSLEFILHSLQPDNSATPPVAFDKAAESAVFGQIVSTYAWLAATPTTTPTAAATATATATATGSPAATDTHTPTPGITPTEPPADHGIVNGIVLAPKQVTVAVFDLSSTNTRLILVNNDGSFSFSAPAGNYRLATVLDGFLSAERTVALTAGGTITMPTISLLAGDIDGNEVIDQFDALTIGMSYNGSSPSAADLNDDGIINVLDLELLAANYRRTGPVAW